jgi:HEAT repeat protein
MRHSTDTAAAAAPSLDDEDRLVAELRSLKSRRSPRAPRIARAVELLEQTGSSRIRNAAALALADLHARDAKDKLINAVNRPETKGSRGTLLYALGELGASVPLPVLTHIVLDDTYEAREEALALIAKNPVGGSPNELKHAKEVLEVAAGSADMERRQAIERALKFLSREPHRDDRR